MSALDRLKLSFRCPADWEAMEGGQTKRFCSHCRKDVHNLSEMSREEAEAVVAMAGDHCVRMLRRADGRLVTKDCPKTVATRTRAVRVAGAGLAAGGALALASCADPKSEAASAPAGEEHEVVGEIKPPEPAVMGLMCPIDERVVGE